MHMRRFKNSRHSSLEAGLRLSKEGKMRESLPVTRSDQQMNIILLIRVNGHAKQRTKKQLN